MLKEIYLIYGIDGNAVLIGAVIIALTVMSAFLCLILYLEKNFKKTNNILCYKKEPLSGFSANSDIIFIIYNAVRHRFEFISQNFEKIMEINKASIIKESKKIFEYLPVEVGKKIMNFMKSADAMNMLEEDYEFIKPVTKNRCWFLLRINRVFIKHNAERYIISIMDITREKQAQKALVEALINQQKESEAKKVFLSHMSHELKTPINGINGMAQMALNSMDDRGKTENYLQKISDSSGKLLTMINNILDISRIDKDKLLLFNEPFHIREALTAFSSIMHSQAELNYQEYTFSMNNIAEEYLVGDCMRLIQILENCVSNSIKFTPMGGRIRLEVTELERHANRVLFGFVITDTGKGMSEEYLKHIYEPFEQEDNSIFKKYGGTGIGMSIVKDLVDLMGGTIQVSSKVNAGTAITIRIAFRLNVNQTGPEEPEAAGEKPVHYDCRGKRILVVEDNEINQEITRGLLNNINLEVETAADGYEALRLFESSEKGYYCAVLMDLQMPEPDGYQTAKAIRSSLHPDSDRICIIALTADDFSDSQLSLDSGMNYHFTKAVHMDKLYELLQTLILKKA